MSINRALTFVNMNVVCRLARKLRDMEREKLKELVQLEGYLDHLERVCHILREFNENYSKGDNLYLKLTQGAVVRSVSLDETMALDLLEAVRKSLEVAELRLKEV